MFDIKEYRRRPEVKRKKREDKKRVRAIAREFIKNYKKDKYCVFCGYHEHTEILQFHHIKDKIDTINNLIQNNHTTIRLKEEIKKCVLLCPNCHMLHHHKEFKEKWQP